MHVCVRQEKQRVIGNPLGSADLMSYTHYELLLVSNQALKSRPIQTWKIFYISVPASVGRFLTPII